MIALELSDVSKSFGTVLAVNSLSLSVGQGEIVSLLGPSGCGKTTTLRLIGGFEQPDRGAVMIAGIDVKGWRPYERNLGILFQDYALFPHMTVAENIAFGLKQRRLPRRQTRDRVAEMLELVKVQELRERYPGQLSGGQKQRVALARALAIEPDLLLLDEPLSALDAKLREELRKELRDTLSAVGSTTIIVTHDQQEAMSLADRILVMNDGRVVQHGSPDEIYSRPGSRFVASFIGRANWILGTLEEAAPAGHCRLRTAGGDSLLVPEPTSRQSTRYEICLRPERIALAPESRDDGEAPRTTEMTNRLRGTVRDVVSLGADVHVYVSTPGGLDLLVIDKATQSRNVAKEDNVSLAIAAGDCIVLPADE